MSNQHPQPRQHKLDSLESRTLLSAVIASTDTLGLSSPDLVGDSYAMISEHIEWMPGEHSSAPFDDPQYVTPLPGSYTLPYIPDPGPLLIGNWNINPTAELIETANGTRLLINGTHRDDKFIIHPERRDENGNIVSPLRVYATVTRFEFDLSIDGRVTTVTRQEMIFEGNADDINEIVIFAGAGDDTVDVVHNFYYPLTDFSWLGPRPVITTVPLPNMIIHGEAGNDTLNGGHGNDVINGGDGDDKIYGNGGDDLILGGNGNDELHGGDGSDVLLGQAGDDELHGQGRNGDSLWILAELPGGPAYPSTGPTPDRLDGGTGADTIYANDGDNADLILADHDDYIERDVDDMVYFTESNAGAVDLTLANNGFHRTTTLPEDLRYSTEPIVINSPEELAALGFDRTDFAVNFDTQSLIIMGTPDYDQGSKTVTSVQYDGQTLYINVEHNRESLFGDTDIYIPNSQRGYNAISVAVPKVNPQHVSTNITDLGNHPNRIVIFDPEDLPEITNPNPLPNPATPLPIPSDIRRVSPRLNLDTYATTTSFTLRSVHDGDADLVTQEHDLLA